LQAEDITPKHQVPHGERMSEDVWCDAMIREIGTLPQTFEKHLDTMHGQSY